MVDRRDAEGTVRCLRERCHLAPWEVADPIWMAQTLLGPDSVQYVHLVATLEELHEDEERTRIYIKRGVPEPVAQWLTGHALSHWIRRTSCGRHGGMRSEEEALCDYVAAALQMPQFAFQRRVNETGCNVQQLALDFGVLETSAALRVGEVEDRPVAVVLRNRLYVAGPDWFQRTAEQVKRDAREGGPGIVTAQLGDPGRRIWVQYVDETG